MDLVHLVACDLDITSTPFFDSTIITYKIQVTPFGKKIVYNLLNNYNFTILYIIDTLSNSPAGHQLSTKDNNNL